MEKDKLDESMRPPINVNAMILLFFMAWGIFTWVISLFGMTYEHSCLVAFFPAIAVTGWVIYRESNVPLDEAFEFHYGPVNTEMICPHCEVKGHIRTKLVEKKQGISGGKATGAILTGGVSMLATGLSRKAEVTQAHCMHCKNVWDF